MSTPIEKSDELILAIKECEQGLPLGPKVKAELAAMREDIQRYKDRLIEINEIVSLEVNRNERSQGVWSDIPEGRIRGDVLKTIVSDPDSNKLLNALHRGGITINEIVRFSQAQRELSIQIGDNFSELSEFIKQYRSGASKFIKATMERCSGARKFLSALRKFGIIEAWEWEMYVYRSNSWAPIKDPAAEYARNRKISNNPLKGIFEIKDRSYDSIIKGDWYTAYAAYIVDDHLTRNRIPHETYTMVSFTAPPDIIRAAGEFDVISLIGNTLLMVECKSGKLSQDVFEHVLERVDGIRRVFKGTLPELENFRFFLLYNPYDNEEESVISSLKDTSVEPLRPDQIRSKFREILSVTPSR